MMVLATFGEATGQGWVQVGELGIAFVLSALIGLERELKQKAAGLRTYTVVGFAAAVFTIVSKYGFTDVLGEHVVLDPSRVTAQIVSGVGFIGGGIIFVRRDAVRGLTTAASVWLTAAIGAAAGAGLPVIATLSTAAYFVAVLCLPPAARVIERRLNVSTTELRVRYVEGRGLLRDILPTLTRAGFRVSGITTTHEAAVSDSNEPASIQLEVLLDGRGDVEGLVNVLSEVEGVLAVSVEDAPAP